MIANEACIFGGARLLENAAIAYAIVDRARVIFKDSN